MYNVAIVKPRDYIYCGMSGLEVVVSVLGLSPTETVSSVLDYGCGHGRVARYLRNYFINAEMTFADVDAGGVNFCATELKGRGLVVPKDVSQVTLPGKYDVIWLGSVFTHIDYERMKILFDKLFAALTPNGVMIGTYRGEKMYRTYLRNPQIAARDADLIRQYEETGIGYMRYAGWQDDWGLSLVHPKRLMDIGYRHPEARMVTYAEVGWAGAHDVIAWTNTSPGTQIR
jgi:SAM-dependent methyltransferase